VSARAAPGVPTSLGRTKLRHNCEGMTFQRQKVSGLVAMLVDGGRWVVSGLLSFRDFRVGPQNGHMPGAALAVAAAQTSAAWPGPRSSFSRFFASIFWDCVSSNLREPLKEAISPCFTRYQPGNFVLTQYCALTRSASATTRRLLTTRSKPNLLHCSNSRAPRRRSAKQRLTRLMPQW
jgi:hypothetical protein